MPPIGWVALTSASSERGGNRHALKIRCGGMRPPAVAADACRRTKAGRHGRAGTSKPSSPARHAAETCAGLVSFEPVGDLLRQRYRVWRRAAASPTGRPAAADGPGTAITGAFPLSILYVTRGSHEAMIRA